MTEVISDEWSMRVARGYSPRSNARSDLLFTMSENTRHRLAPGHEYNSRGRRLAADRRLQSPNGGARRDRTDDLMLAKHALSQLSYGPDDFGPPSLKLRRDSLRKRWLAEPKLRMSEGWWAWEDLNFRPHAYQARALTN